MELGLVLVILFAGTDESPSDSSLSLSRSVKCCCRFNSIIVALIVTDCSNLPSSIPNGKGNETGSVEGSKHHFTCGDGCSKLESMLYIAITQVPGMALCLGVL